MFQNLCHKLSFCFYMCIVDDLVIFSYNVDDMEHLFAALEEFCHSSGLTINVDKTKMMAV